MKVRLIIQAERATKIDPCSKKCKPGAGIPNAKEIAFCLKCERDTCRGTNQCKGLQEFRKKTEAGTE